MNAAVKLLTAHYPVMQIVWARFTGHLIIMLIVFLPHYRRRLLATRRPLMMLISNLVFALAIGRVPLAIGFSSPLIVTAPSMPLHVERVGSRRWSAACC